MSGTIKKMQVYHVEVVSPVCSFIKNETPAQAFSCEFWENFQPVSLIKETPVQVLYCEFCKMFKNTYIVNYQRTAASNVWLLIDSS